MGVFVVVVVVVVVAVVVVVVVVVVVLVVADVDCLILGNNDNASIFRFSRLADDWFYARCCCCCCCCCCCGCCCCCCCCCGLVLCTLPGRFFKAFCGISHTDKAWPVVVV